jgi:flagellar biosynthesis/type III secretory pathway M-ring protein FliF/YscJ
MELLLAIVLLALVAAFVSVPLRRKADDNDPDPREAERAELEARKEAKYREIRDAEADRASGKLTEQDFGRINRELRGEAIEILKRIDRLEQD